jgi:NAD(P) transhydrogenase
VDVLEHQFLRNGVHTAAGFARFAGPHTLAITAPDGSTLNVDGERILIAVGTVPFHPDTIDFSDPDIMDSDDVVDLHRLPRSLTVVGAGVIGIEYATVFSALDVAVTVIEPRDTFLDFIDREIIDEFIHQLRDRGVGFRLGSPVALVTREEGARSPRNWAMGARCAPTCCFIARAGWAPRAIWGWSIAG